MQSFEKLADCNDVFVPSSKAPLAGDDSEGWRSLITTPLPKRYLTGTHRTKTPEETLRQVRPHLPKMGITRIANLTGLDCIGIPVVMVCRPNSRSLSTSLGKGLDLDAAIASGVMECIELHHAERITWPLILASEVEMRARLPLIRTDQLPSVKNGRYHENLPLLWIQGCDLMSLQPVWLPFEVVHASASVPAATGSGCFAATSNGLASGNHPLEALVHALLEVIERDSTAIWGAGGAQRRESTLVDLKTVTDPACLSVIERCHSAGVHVTVFETTSDLGIPSYLCEIREAYSDLSVGPVFSGLGCHFDRGIALLRALTEAVQSRLTLIAGSRDDLGRRDYIANGYPPPKEPQRRFRADGDDLVRGETFNDDLALTLDRLRAIGVPQVAVVDLTDPDFQIPVIRAVIPTLEGPDDDPDYVPGPRARAHFS